MIAIGVSISVFYYILTLRASGKNRLALQMDNDLDKRKSPTLGDMGDFRMMWTQYTDVRFGISRASLWGTIN